MNYKEYLQSDEWQKLRKQAIKRANGKCELCSAPFYSVHHSNYPKNFKEDTLDNLIVVCRKCHDRLHGITDNKDHLMKVIEKRTNWKEEEEYPFSYLGFDMSKTHSQDNSSITEHNLSLLNLFNDFLDVDYISKHFDCWKGVCYFKKEEIREFMESNEEEFSGWLSKDILFWLITKKGKYRGSYDESI